MAESHNSTQPISDRPTLVLQVSLFQTLRHLRRKIPVIANAVTATGFRSPHSLGFLFPLPIGVDLDLWSTCRQQITAIGSGFHFLFYCKCVLHNTPQTHCLARGCLFLVYTKTLWRLLQPWLKACFLQSSVSIDALGRENKMTEMKSGTSAGKLRPCCLFYTTRNVAKDKTHLHKSQGVLFGSLLASQLVLLEFGHLKGKAQELQGLHLILNVIFLLKRVHFSLLKLKTIILLICGPWRRP